MRYYKKMLRTFISIALIYVVVISTFFILGYHYISQKEFKRSMESKFNEMFYYTDSRISAVRQVSQVICASDLTTRYLTENTSAPDQYGHLQLAKLVNTVNTLSLISGYSSILVTKLSDNYAITNNSSGNLDYALNHLQIERDKFDNVINNFSNSYGISIQILENNTFYENTTYHFVSRQWVNTYPFYTVVTFTKDNLFELENLSNSVFAIMKDNQIVALAGNMNEQETQNILEKTDSLYITLQKKSDTSGYSYVMITKRPSFFNNIIWLINIASVLILLLSITVMYFITKKMYHPIAQTMSKTVGTEEESFDEFTSIQQSFNSMQNNIQKIEHQLELYYISSENKFFYDLLTGLIPKEQLTEKFREFDILKTSGKFVTVLIRFNEMQVSGTDTSHNLLYQTRRSLLLAMKNNSSLYRVVDLSLTLEAFIFRCSDIKLLTSELRNLCLNVEPAFGLEISAYIGSVAEGLQNIHSSFLQASYLANQAEYSFSYSRILVQSELQENTHNNKYTVYYPISMEQSMIGAVTSGKTTIWKNALSNIIDINMQKNPESLNLLAQMLATTMNRILGTATEETDSIFGSDSKIYKTFLKCTTYQELSAKAEETIIKLTDYLEKKVENSSSSIKKKMTDYIHQNYAKDISLIDLADYLNMSKNYISSLFKETTGYNFKEYLSEYRMNKARELINEKSDKIKIQEVATAVGCNKDSLLRLFMRYEGMTPSEYQRKIIASKQTS